MGTRRSRAGGADSPWTWRTKLQFHTMLDAGTGNGGVDEIDASTRKERVRD